MAEKYFKFMVVAFFCVAAWALFVGLTTEDESQTYNVAVTQVIDADKGLDLRAVGEVLKQAKTAEEFEKLLNSPDVGANNLDLNADGQVDYINVTEFGDDEVKGFSLTTEVAKGEVQELATIKIQKTGEGEAKVETHGNPSVYGNNHYYRSAWSPGLGTGLMLGYLFGAHRPYYSPWGYGRSPGYYRPYATQAAGSYGNRWGGAGANYSSANSSGFGSTVRSPNAGKNATSVKAGLKNPTASQRSFQARRAKASRRSGGFGRSSSARRSSSVRRSSFGRGSRSFGGK